MAVLDRSWRWLILAAVPLAAVSLWLASGREVLTKPFKLVDSVVSDNLFGGTNIEKREVRGPVFGYFIGLDAVLIVFAVSGVGALLMWLIDRRYRRSALVGGGKSHDC